MKKMILRVKNKNNLESIEKISEVIYVSRFLNIVGVEVREENVEKLEKDDNVLSLRESENGEYQPCAAN